MLYEKTEHLVIDHCRKANRVRGLLCYGCNIAMGHVDIDGWVDRALKYSRKA